MAEFMPQGLWPRVESSAKVFNATGID